jgi:uncharacterized protein (UPF0261 family)
MAERPKVLLIVTQDTKYEEGKFLRECLEDGGCDVVHLDASVRRTVGGAEISPEEIAGAAGKTIEEVRALGHEGKCQAVMIEGSIKLALQAHQEYGFAGVLSVGGSMGTTLGTFVMQQFPYGIPKLMISTLASGFTAPFVGLKDIAMLNAVCDISGLNSIARDVFRNGAYAIAGAAKAYQPVPPDSRPLVLVSTLGTTERALRALRLELEADGYEVMAFHTTGNGGKTLDAIATDRNVAAVVDMSLVELNDLLNDGICNAGPARATAGVAKGVPTIFAPGNCDFYIMPSPMAVGDSPFGGRKFHIHNPALTAVRTNRQDLERLADHVAGIVKDATGPVRFYVPLKGFSNHDSPEGHIHEPSLPPLFAAYVEQVMPAHVEVRRFDCHINDPEFASALAQAVRELSGATQKVPEPA